jgi:hypothetical protein
VLKPCATFYKRFPFISGFDNGGARGFIAFSILVEREALAEREAI